MTGPKDRKEAQRRQIKQGEDHATEKDTHRGLRAGALVSGAVGAEPVKVGMITTLSGGGAGLGIDVRDGFQLALKMAGDAGAEVELTVEDDQQEARHCRADRRQDDPV